MKTKVTVTTYGEVPMGSALDAAERSVKYWQGQIDDGAKVAQGLLKLWTDAGCFRTCTTATLTGWAVKVMAVTEGEES